MLVRTTLHISISLLVTVSIHAQNKLVRGLVLDAITKETLHGCYISSLDNKFLIATDREGRFSFTLDHLDSMPTFVCKYLGYQTDTVELTSNGINIVKLSSYEINLQEVEIRSEKITKSRHEVFALDAKQVQKIPALFGDTDVLGSFQLLPGIEVGPEGTAGLYVRGGTPDQNLILLDGVPVYYAYHLGGFNSTFASNIAKSVALHHNFIPSKYTGRLSSVLDITTYDGDRSSLKKEISIGLLSSSVSLKGPVGSKSSFLISARRTPYDLILAAYSRLFLEEKLSIGYYFLDGMIKLNHRINPRNELNFSFFQSFDKAYIRINSDNLDKQLFYNGLVESLWGNQLLSMNWQKVNRKWIIKTVLSYGRFFFKTNINTELRNQDSSIIEFDQRIRSRIEDIVLRSEFSRSISKDVDLRVGTESSSKNFIPLSQVTKRKNQIYDSGDSVISVLRTSVFGETEITLKRYSLDIKTGFNATYDYTRNKFNVDPRTIIHYTKNDWVLSASYQRLSQNLHLLRNSSNGYPADVWVPSFNSIRDQQASQLWIGSSFTIKKVDLSFGGFSRNFRNLITLKEGLDLFGTRSLEAKIQSGGVGKSSGLELKIDLNYDGSSGWMSYTRSTSFRKFNEINNNEWFRSPYSRDHSLSVVFNQTLGPQVSLGVNFTAFSGYYITFPTTKYGMLTNELSDQNQSTDGISTIYTTDQLYNYKTPTYHRLDLSIQFKKKTTNYIRYWKLGIYNVYNRHNSYYFYIEQNNDGTPLLYSISIFPILPSFSFVKEW